MSGVRILLGAALLLLGRRLFWLALGILGFLFGFDWMTYHMAEWPPWSAWLAGVALGAVCAIGAIFLQRVFFGVAGFLAGGYLTEQFLVALGVQNDPAPGVLFLLGGVAGVILAVVAVDWVLIGFTSLVGAAAVAEGIGVGPLGSGLVFLGLTVIGMAVQTAAHDFAHVLDRAAGVFDGTPRLRSRSLYRPWAQILSRHYLKLRKGDREERKVLRDYGATNGAEFFAVATESYFEKPRQMRTHAPDLYRELQEFYGGDPAGEEK